MPLTHIASEAAAVKRALNGGGTLLVVGARSTNFDEAIRTHPRVTVWDSTDPKSDTRQPAENTKVIICTRFLGHHQFAKLQRFAQKKHILMMPGLGGTGEIKEVIQMALGTPAVTMPPPTSTVPPPAKTFFDPSPAIEMAAADTDVAAEVTPKRGQLKDWVKTHADLNGSPTKEAQRLLPLAHAAGWPNTTSSSLAQAVYMLRREREGLPSQYGTRSKAAPAPVTPPPSNISDALRLVDEVSAGLSLLREAVLKVQSDEAAMQATMTALRGFLNGGH